MSYLVGFESEFVLLKETSPVPIPVNDKDYAVSQKLACGAVETIVLEEIANTLEDAGIEITKYHAEAAPGQVCLNHLPSEQLPQLTYIDSTKLTQARSRLSKRRMH